MGKGITPSKSRVHFQIIYLALTHKEITVHVPNMAGMLGNVPGNIGKILVYHRNGLIGFPGAHSEFLSDKGPIIISLKIVQNIDSVFLALDFFLYKYALFNILGTGIF